MATEVLVRNLIVGMFERHHHSAEALKGTENKNSIKFRNLSAEYTVRWRFITRGYIHANLRTVIV